MEGKETYYEILGINKDATGDDVRKAYRRQALLWHPDKNGHRREEAEAKFKVIAEAYEVLSDADKRKLYDLYGEEGLRNGGPAFETTAGPQFGHFSFRDPNEIFRRFFGNSGGFFGNSFFDDSPFPDPFTFGGMPRSSPFPNSSLFSDPMFGHSMSSSSSSTFSSFGSGGGGGGGGGGYMRTTRTQIVNGVKTTVTRTEENGVVTEETTVSSSPGSTQHFIQDNYGTQRSIPIQDGNSYYSPTFMQHQGRNIAHDERLHGNQRQYYESQQELSRSGGSIPASNYREDDSGTKRGVFYWKK